MSTLPRPSSTSGCASGSDTESYSTPQPPRVFVKSASAAPASLQSNNAPLAPPPIAANPEKRALILNKLAARNAKGIHVDRDALLNSIKGGVRLRKTKTKDCSSAILNDKINTETQSRPESPTSIWSLDSHGFVFYFF